VIRMEVELVIAIGGQRGIKKFIRSRLRTGQGRVAYLAGVFLFFSFGIKR